MSLHKTVTVLNHIRSEQINHGEHGDQEYIRLCNEALAEIYSLLQDNTTKDVYSISPEEYLELTNKL